MPANKGRTVTEEEEWCSKGGAGWAFYFAFCLPGKGEVSVRQEGICGIGGISPSILNLGTRWRWVVTLTPQLFHRWGKCPSSTHRIGRWVGPEPVCDTLEKRNVSWECRESNRNFLVLGPVAWPQQVEHWMRRKSGEGSVGRVTLGKSVYTISSDSKACFLLHGLKTSRLAYCCFVDKSFLWGIYYWVRILWTLNSSDKTSEFLLVGNSSGETSEFLLVAMCEIADVETENYT